MTAAGSGPVVVGVIGAGKISEQYLANMKMFPDLDVRFVADLIPARAEAVATEFGVPEFGTPEAALAHEDVELIVNLTIPAAHADVATAAITTGKHVWNEKPLSVDRESGRAMLDLADAAGLLVGCAPDTFLGPGLQTVRRLIERGDIGRPLTASVAFLTSGPHTWHPNADFLYQRGGGPLLDMGPYYLTGLTQIFGSVTGVVARGTNAAPTRVIAQGPRAGQVIDVSVSTYVTAIYDFETGGIAQGTFSFDSPLSRMGVFEISGTEATLAAPDPNYFGGDIHLVRTGTDEWQSIPVTGVEGGRGIGVLDLARAVRGHRRHRASGRLGLHILDAMLATDESIAEGVFAAVGTRIEAVPPLPEGWDPTERTL